MASKKEALASSIKASLMKSRSHLEYSFNKVKAFTFDKEFSEEELETLESFSSRFARFSDLAISKYLRFLATREDPAFRGSVIDLLNQSEKFGWIDSANEWRRIRELRNIAAHEYSEEDYRELYRELIRLTPVLLNLSLDHAS